MACADAPADPIPAPVSPAELDPVHWPMRPMVRAEQRRLLWAYGLGDTGTGMARTPAGLLSLVFYTGVAGRRPGCLVVLNGDPGGFFLDGPSTILRWGWLTTTPSRWGPRCPWIALSPCRWGWRMAATVGAAGTSGRSSPTSCDRPALPGTVPCVNLPYSAPPKRAHPSTAIPAHPAEHGALTARSLPAQRPRARPPAGPRRTHRLLSAMGPRSGLPDPFWTRAVRWVLSPFTALPAPTGDPDRLDASCDALAHGRFCGSFGLLPAALGAPAAECNRVADLLSRL